jgi:hypothetical protein
LQDKSPKSAADQVLSPGLPRWITGEAIRDTIETFRPIYGPKFSADDAIGILINVGILFSVLKGETSKQAEQSAHVEQAASRSFPRLSPLQTRPLAE